MPAGISNIYIALPYCLLRPRSKCSSLHFGFLLLEMMHYMYIWTWWLISSFAEMPLGANIAWALMRNQWRKIMSCVNSCSLMNRHQNQGFLGISIYVVHPKPLFRFLEDHVSGLLTSSVESRCIYGCDMTSFIVFSYLRVLYTEDWFHQASSILRPIACMAQIDNQCDLRRITSVKQILGISENLRHNHRVLCVSTYL